MTWTWRLEDAAGKAVAVDTYPDRGFPNRSDAESWVGEVWQDLLDQGVEQVRLFDDDHEIYGPMSLRSA